MNTTKTSGFSLIEMLVVLAVIGVISAIAVPNVRKNSRQARDEKDQRNAQQIASVVSAADEAGYDFINGSSSVAEVINLVRTGHTITAVENPSMAGTYFGVPALGSADRTGASKFLTITAARLVYAADLAPPTNASHN